MTPVAPRIGCPHFDEARDESAVLSGVEPNVRIGETSGEKVPHQAARDAVFERLSHPV